MLQEGVGLPYILFTRETCFRGQWLTKYSYGLFRVSSSFSLGHSSRILLCEISGRVFSPSVLCSRIVHTRGMCSPNVVSIETEIGILVFVIRFLKNSRLVLGTVLVAGVNRLSRASIQTRSTASALKAIQIQQAAIIVTQKDCNSPTFLLRVV